MPESFAASGRVSITQPYPVVSGSGTVQIDGGDNGAATGDVTISRSRFFSFGTGIGPGIYKSPVRMNGVRVSIGGQDFSDFLDGAVEVKSTLENYIAVTTARFSVRNQALAYWSPQSISTQEQALTIDFQSGPPGHVETWRALTGWTQPTPNDEPWMPAAQFSGRSWLADILGQQVCVELHAYSGLCRRDILVQLAASAGYTLVIQGPSGATPKKAVSLNGVTFQQVLARYCEIEGWIALDSATPGLLTLIPESQWLSSVVNPSSALFTFGADDGMSYLEFKETPPSAPVTSWTISGTAPGPGQSQWGTGSALPTDPAQDGTITTDTWAFAGSYFQRTLITTTRVFGTLTNRNTTVQRFNWVSTSEPFWWAPQSGVLAQPTTMYYQLVTVEGTTPGGTYGTLSQVQEDYVYYQCLLSSMVRSSYGFDSLGVYGLRRVDHAAYNATLASVGMGYSIVTASNLYDEYNSGLVPLPGGFYGNEATQETYIASDGNGNYTHTTAVQKYYPLAWDVSMTSGSGVDDISFSGDYTGTTPVSYVVSIATTGTPDTFTWSGGGGGASSVAITGHPQLMNHGKYVSFGSTTGHTAGNSWQTHSLPFPNTSVTSETGSGGIPLPLMGSPTEKPVTEEQPFLATASVTALDFPIVEKNEFISDLENTAEAQAVAMRRLRWEYAVGYTTQGRILPTERIGAPEGISNYVRNMTNVGCFVATLTQSITPPGQGQSGDNLCERGLVAMLPWMIPAQSGGGGGSSTVLISLSLVVTGTTVTLTWRGIYNGSPIAVNDADVLLAGDGFTVLASSATSPYVIPDLSVGTYTYFVRGTLVILGQSYLIYSNMQTAVIS